MADLATLELALQTAIEAGFDTDDGVQVVIDEPEVLPRLPIVWLRWVGVDPVRDAETGIGQDWVEQWLVHLDLDATNMAAAQTQMKTLLPKLLDAFRADPTLGDTADRLVARISEEPEFFRRAGNDLLYGVQLRVGVEHTRNG